MAKIKIAKYGYEGYEGETEIWKYALHSGYKLQKIAQASEYNLTMLSNTDYASGVIYHNLGYIPLFFVFIEHGSKGYEACGNSNPSIEVPAYGGGNTRVTFDINADSSKLNFEAWASWIFGNVANNETFKIRVFFILDEIV